MPMLADLELDRGRLLEQWTAEELREAVRELARSLDRQIETRAQPPIRRSGTMMYLRDLLDFGKALPKAKRGRKPTVDITDDELVGYIEIGRRHGAPTDIEAIRQFVRYWCERSGKHTAGERPNRVAQRLQKRLSEHRRRLPKLKS